MYSYFFVQSPVSVPYSTTSTSIEFSPSTSSTSFSTSQSVEPNPIIFTGEALPSVSISNKDLQPVEEVASRYATKANENEYTQFTLKLAYQTFFGPEIMRQCSAMGERGRVGLPHKELSELKKIIFSKFPRFGNEQEKFEPKNM